MKSFSELSRKVFSIQGEMQLYMRFKEKGCNLQKRKELRRLKNINTYSREYTGQQNPHGWFTPKRYKSIGTFIENVRNMHPGTLPIAPEIKKQISEKFTEDSHWNYYNYRNYMKQEIALREIKEKTVVKEEYDQIPSHLRNEILKMVTEEDFPEPKHVNPLFLYSQQNNIFLPQDERHRINLHLKIDNPPLEKNVQE